MKTKIMNVKLSEKPQKKLRDTIIRENKLTRANHETTRIEPALA